MVELDNFKTVLGTYKAPLVEVRDALDLINKQQKIQELEREMEAPDFWNYPAVLFLCDKLVNSSENRV